MMRVIFDDGIVFIKAPSNLGPEVILRVEETNESKTNNKNKTETIVPLLRDHVKK